MKKTFLIALILAALPTPLFSMETDRSLPAQDVEAITLPTELWRHICTLFEPDLPQILQQRRVCQIFNAILHNENIIKALAKSFVRQVKPSERDFNEKLNAAYFEVHLPTGLVSLSEKQIECLTTFLTSCTCTSKEKLTSRESSLVKFLFKAPVPNATALTTHILHIHAHTVEEALLKLPFISTFGDLNVFIHRLPSLTGTNEAFTKLYSTTHLLLSAITTQETYALVRQLVQALHKSCIMQGNPTYQASRDIPSLPNQGFYYNFEHLIEAAEQAEQNEKELLNQGS